MKYSLLVYESQTEIDKREDAQYKDAYWGAYSTYSKALQEAGVLVGGSALQPSFSATTIKLQNHDRWVQDGPYADTKEQLGGYFEIEVADLDTALDWAARCPATATGAVEVRPILPMA